jgi:hypothetical protein
MSQAEAVDAKACPGREFSRMSELLSVLKVAGTVLGAWCLISVLVAVPLAGLLRVLALRNARLAPEARRADWVEAATAPLEGPTILG